MSNTHLVIPDQHAPLSHYHRNKEKYHANWKRWKEDNADAYHTYNQKRYNERLLDPAKYLWTIAKARARRKGFAFDLDISDLVVPEACPVFKQPLAFGTRYSYSTDRIDNSSGYIKGNVQVISRLANSMKYDATAEELKLFAEWVLSDV